MTIAEILAIISGVTQALPSLLALLGKATNGGTVTQADVQAALAQYGVVHSQLDADIKAAGG